jgi:hypothetical protein
MLSVCRLAPDPLNLNLFKPGIHTHFRPFGCYLIQQEYFGFVGSEAFILVKRMQSPAILAVFY